jgi:hypothetical protein
MMGYDCYGILEFDTRSEAEYWIQQTEEWALRTKRREVLTEVKGGADE